MRLEFVFRSAASHGCWRFLFANSHGTFNVEEILAVLSWDKKQICCIFLLLKRILKVLTFSVVTIGTGISFKVASISEHHVNKNNTYFIIFIVDINNINFLVFDIGLRSWFKEADSLSSGLIINKNGESQFVLLSFVLVLQFLDWKDKLVTPEQLPSYKIDGGCVDFLIAHADFDVAVGSFLMVKVGQNRTDYCYTFFFWDHLLLIGYSVGNCNCGHQFVFQVEEVTGLGVAFVINNFHGAGKLWVGIFGVVLDVVGGSFDFEGDVVVEGQGNILVPDECMGVHLGVFSDCLSGIFFITDVEGADSNWNTEFIVLDFYVLYHQHLIINIFIIIIDQKWNDIGTVVNEKRQKERKRWESRGETRLWDYFWYVLNMV